MGVAPLFREGARVSFIPILAAIAGAGAGSLFGNAQNKEAQQNQQGAQQQASATTNQNLMNALQQLAMQQQANPGPLSGLQAPKGPTPVGPASLGGGTIGSTPVPSAGPPAGGAPPSAAPTQLPPALQQQLSGGPGVAGGAPAAPQGGDNQALIAAITAAMRGPQTQGRAAAA